MHVLAVYYSPFSAFILTQLSPQHWFGICVFKMQVISYWVKWVIVGEQLPSCSCPIQGHCYCPLVKSVRPSLTQIRFLSKWDFYCSKGAGSRISLPQPFPVSFWRGSAALLLFFIPPPLPPHLLWDKSGTVATWFCFCQPSLDFKEWKFLKKKKGKKRHPPTLLHKP